MTHSHDTATPALSVESGEVLSFTYTNWRGETALRRVRAKGACFRFGSTEWHSEPQWLLSAIDLDKMEGRDFAVRDVVFAAHVPNPSPAAKGGEDWTGKKCPACKGHGRRMLEDGEEHSCPDCGGTGDEFAALATPSPQPADAVREAECPDDPHEAYSKGWNDATEEYDAKGLDQVARMKLEKQVRLLVEGLEAETVARKKAEAERDALREQSARNAVQLAYSNNDRIDLARVRTELERADEALRWYAENVQGFGRPGSVGALYGGLLDADGGRRARDALASDPAPAGEAVEPLKDRIDNAVQAMSETHHSWESRCHAIMAALGFNFGWSDPKSDEEPVPEDTARLRADLERVTRELAFERQVMADLQRGYDELDVLQRRTERERDDARKALETAAEDERDRLYKLATNHGGWSVPVVVPGFIRECGSAMLPADRAAARSASREGASDE